MNKDYLFALIFDNDRRLTDEQIQSLRSEAHALGDYELDSLCAQALDNWDGARAKLTAYITDKLRRMK